VYTLLRLTSSKTVRRFHPAQDMIDDPLWYGTQLDDERTDPVFINSLRETYDLSNGQERGWFFTYRGRPSILRPRLERSYVRRAARRSLPTSRMCGAWRASAWPPRLASM